METDYTDVVPPMPFETPPLKVSRPVAACSRCRNAKIKCDGKLPACSSCEKNGRAAECTSTNDQFARGKERSYVATLETRIDRLQARLEEARARKPSVVSVQDDETPAPSRRPSRGVPVPELPPTVGSRAQRRKEASAIDDLVSDFGFLSVNATARDFYGFTSAMSYARLILSACTKDPLPSGTTKELPPRYVATALIQHYLKGMFVLLPVFEEASFYASVDNVYARDMRKAEPFDHWTVRMVLAIASVSMSEQRGDQHYLEGIGHVCAALSQAEAVLHPGSISSVQALIMLTEYAMLDPHHLDSWSLIGAASRAMVDLGLHQDPPKGAPMTKGKLDLRRRVFWCVYALDRSTSLVQTRAFSFSDDSAKVKIPFSKAPAVLPVGANPPGLPKPWLQSHEQALDLIHLRQIQSNWYTELFQSGRERWNEPYHYLWRTCDSMRKWFDNLSVTMDQSMRACFELEMLYSYIYVLSPSPRVPAISSFAAKLIFEYGIRYAELMLCVVNDSAHTPPLTFYDAMRVYMTGRQFLDVLQHNTDALLNGHIPPHPEVKPTSAPPPAMPVLQLPPGETLPRSNTVRSIRCIKQISDCLSKFGIRWGYMSWSQRYQTETADILENLHQRLRELDDLTGARRPSMWHHSSSAGSVHSSNGTSIGYQSPQSLPPGSIAYRQPSITAHHLTSYGEPGQPAQPTATAYHHQQIPFQQQPTQPWEPQTQFFQQPGGQAFSFGQQQAPRTHGLPHGNPNQQFAAWSGYGGLSVPDTLDEENAEQRRSRKQLYRQFLWLKDSDTSLSSAQSEVAPDQPAPQHQNLTQTQHAEQHAQSSGWSSSESQGLYVAPAQHQNVIQARQAEQQAQPCPESSSDSQGLYMAPAQNQNVVQAQQAEQQAQSYPESSSDSQGLYIAPAQLQNVIQAQQTGQHARSYPESSSDSQGLYMAPIRHQNVTQPRQFVQPAQSAAESTSESQGLHMALASRIVQTAGGSNRPQLRRASKGTLDIMHARHESKLGGVETGSGDESPEDEPVDPLNQPQSSSAAFQLAQMQMLQQGQMQVEQQEQKWSSGPDSEGLQMATVQRSGRVVDTTHPMDTDLAQTVGQATDDPGLARNPRAGHVLYSAFAQSPLRQVQNFDRYGRAREGSSELTSATDYLGLGSLMPQPSTSGTGFLDTEPENRRPMPPVMYQAQPGVGLFNAMTPPTGTGSTSSAPSKRKSSMQDHYSDFLECAPWPEPFWELRSTTRRERTPRVHRSPKVRKKGSKGKEPAHDEAQAGPSRFDGDDELSSGDEGPSTAAERQEHVSTQSGPDKIMTDPHRQPTMPQPVLPTPPSFASAASLASQYPQEPPLQFQVVD